jgi:hypothetical protein
MAKEVLSNYVLYSDNPQRHYRQIAAMLEDGACGVYVWEGLIVQTEPFERLNPDAEFVLCRDKQQAMAEAEREHEESLTKGWNDYDRTLD